jgi:hypothetical protein
MKAKFTRGSDGHLGIRFEPETFDEQLLLEIFTRDAHARPNEFRFFGWEHNNQARALREGLTSCWGEIAHPSGYPGRTVSEDGGADVKPPR